MGMLFVFVAHQRCSLWLVKPNAAGAYGPERLHLRRPRQPHRSDLTGCGGHQLRPRRHGPRHLSAPAVGCHRRCAGSRLGLATAGATDLVARTYDPGLGAFASLDSVQPTPANPLSLNRFLYAGGNPATYTDPSGHVVTTGTICSNSDAGPVPIAAYAQRGRWLLGVTSRRVSTGHAIRVLPRWSARSKESLRYLGVGHPRRNRSRISRSRRVSSPIPSPTSRAA